MVWLLTTQKVKDSSNLKNYSYALINIKLLLKEYILIDNRFRYKNCVIVAQNNVPTYQVCHHDLEMSHIIE